MSKDEKKTSVERKLELILENQKKILKNEQKILGEENKIEQLEEKELDFEKNEQKSEEEMLKNLEELENKIKNTSSPLTKITQKDMVKGFVGAFIGVVGHFAFTKATDLAPKLDFFHTLVLYITAFIMVSIMLYYTGFRSIEKHVVLKIMPLRATVLFLVSILAIIFVYILFGKITFNTTPYEYFTLVGASIILGVLGAGMADLIGRNE